MEQLSFSLSNAAGWAKTPDQVHRLAQIPYLSEIIVGSFTVEQRDGNTGGTNFAVLDDGTAVNSIGLANCGLKMLRVYIDEMAAIAHDHGKRLIASIAGFNLTEYIMLAYVVAQSNADGIEINLGCPNVWENGERKAVVAYDPSMTETVVRNVTSHRSGKEVRVKLSVYDKCPEVRPLVAEKITPLADHVSAVVCCNTKPDFCPTNDDGTPLLGVANGIGGMSGTALRPLAIEEAREFRALLPESVDVTGVGGISRGSHLMERLNLGCRSIQIGTAFFWNENFRVFQDIMEEFVSLPGAEHYIESD